MLINSSIIRDSGLMPSDELGNSGTGSVKYPTQIPTSHKLKHTLGNSVGKLEPMKSHKINNWTYWAKI